MTIPLHPCFSTAPERTSPPGSDPDDNLDYGREAGRDMRYMKRAGKTPAIFEKYI